MILSLSLNATMLCAFAICPMYTLDDLELVMNTPTGLAIVEVCNQAIKNEHASNFLVLAWHLF